ncbi:hypothetical protein EV426DRAFT_701502 [Tirmania nivea]|nr:hypothetical protein EV426DRAFT_701502 [Tirmania nivea]
MASNSRACNIQDTGTGASKYAHEVTTPIEVAIKKTKEVKTNPRKARAKAYDSFIPLPLSPSTPLPPPLSPVNAGNEEKDTSQKSKSRVTVPPALPHDVAHRLPTSYAKAAALPTPANLKADKGKRKATEPKPTQTTSAASPPSYIHPSRVPLVNAFSAFSSITHTPSGQAAARSPPDSNQMPIGPKSNRNKGKEKEPSRSSGRKQDSTETILAAMCTTHLVITGCNAPPRGSQWKRGFIEAWNNRRRRLMPSCPMDLTTVMTARSYPTERELIIRHPKSLSPEVIKANVATLRQEMYPTMLRGPSDKMVSIKEECVEMVVEGFEGKKGELAWDRAAKVSKALGIKLAVRPPKWL